MPNISSRLYVFLTVQCFLNWTKDTKPILIAIGAIAIFTFFTFFKGNNSREVNGNSMRNAIAGTFVITYILLVITFSVYSLVDPGRKIDITETLVKHFTVLVGTIVGFYFAASTVVESMAKWRSRGEPDQGESR